MKLSDNCLRLGVGGAGADLGFFRVLEHPFPGMGPISYDYGLI